MKLRNEPGDIVEIKQPPSADALERYIQDADDPENFRPRSYAPAAQAAAAFAGFLRRDGIHLAGPPRQVSRARGAATVAEVRSPVLS